MRSPLKYHVRQMQPRQSYVTPRQMWPNIARVNYIPVPFSIWVLFDPVIILGNTIMGCLACYSIHQICKNVVCSVLWNQFMRYDEKCDISHAPSTSLSRINMLTILKYKKTFLIHLHLFSYGGVHGNWCAIPWTAE